MSKHKLGLLLLIIGNTLLFQMFVAGVSNAETKADNKLAVVVTAMGKSIHIKGYCIYVKDGRTIRKNMEKDDAWGWNFRGNMIKKVQMRKISGDASFRMYVIRNGKYLFESDSTSSSEPIVYERKAADNDTASRKN